MRLSDVELPMCFESAHIVPKLFNCFHFVTTLRIAYDEPRGPSQATRLSKHKNVVSCKKKSLSADAIQTKDQTLNMVGVYSNTASAIEAVRKKVTQLPWAHLRGRFGKLIFHMVLYILKCTCFSGDILINYCSPLY